MDHAPTRFSLTFSVFAVCLGALGGLHAFTTTAGAPTGEGRSGDTAAASGLSCDKVGAVILCNVPAETLQAHLDAEARKQEAADKEKSFEAAWDAWRQETTRRDKEAREREALARLPSVNGGYVLSVTAPAAPAEVERIMAAAGVPPEWRGQFAAIAWCESRWRRDAVGDGGSSLGMWQLWRGWFDRAGIDLTYWADPVANARVAIYVRQSRGRFGGGGGWTCAGLLGID
jgi:hypothetical protein